MLGGGGGGAGGGRPNDEQRFGRQLEVELAQLEELSKSVNESRAKLAKAIDQRPLELKRPMTKSVVDLEDLKADVEGKKRRFEEKLNAVRQQGGDVNVAPRRPLDAKVTAVDSATGQVVISMGKDDGIVEGDEFTVYRGGDDLAKISIHRSDRKWAAGKVVLKTSDPRVGDDVTNLLFLKTGRPVANWAACTSSTVAMDVVTASEDGRRVTLTVSDGQVLANQVYAVTRAGKFVGLISVLRVTGSQVDAQVAQNLTVGRILPGDRAVHVSDPKSYLSALPVEVRMDLASRANQKLMRAKMGLKE